MPYWEGQSYGVIPPGTNPKNGKPNSVRLYSIASSRYGDDMTGTTTSLCVRRATYWCPELKADDPAKKGAPEPLLRPRPSSRTRAIIRRRSARACGGRARLRGAVRLQQLPRRCRGAGVCSNFLCDTKPGDEVKLTGPSGKVMLLPESNPNADLIMVRRSTLPTELLCGRAAMAAREGRGDG